MHETRISGIPCLIEVLGFTKGYPAKTNAEPDHCYEGVPDEFEWVVCARNGRPAPWLEAKLTDHDISRINTELGKAQATYDPY